ncbi:MAG: hypothetical protein WAN58_13745 [Anaerolineales bacterium]
MKILGLRIKVERTALYGFGVLVLVPLIFVPLFTIIFKRAAFDFTTLRDGFLVGICFAIYHEIAQLAHQFGHALVARATGYPMTGIRYEYSFSFSEYPANEPKLPDRIHIQRSLGGVAALTILLLVVVGIWTSVHIPADGFVHWLRNFILFDAIFMFFTSAVLSDGVLFIRNQNWKNPNS